LSRHQNSAFYDALAAIGSKRRYTREIHKDSATLRQEPGKKPRETAASEKKREKKRKPEREREREREQGEETQLSTAS